jgi:dTMP kinase
MAATRKSLESLAGTFIVLDGVEGCGKTTVQRRVADHLTGLGLSVTTCRDPGGTPIGERIRSVLLDHDLGEMAMPCETLLFMASRAQLVAEVVRPAMDRGNVVLCDRFVSATCAYQGAIGADRARVIELANFATGRTWPDLTVVLDVPIDVGFARLGRRLDVGDSAAGDAGANGLDAMERRPKAFHQRVREGFLALPEYYPGRTVVVDANRPIDAVVDDVLERLAIR